MAVATKKNKYNLTDSANMLRGLASGDKSKQVDANGDGKMNLSDVSTMMKFTAGWSPEAAMDPYKGKEVTPGDYGKSQEYLLGKVVNREPFEFSGTESPIYQAYAKQYKREGDLAAKDTLSKVSARTGGVPSSYAVTATAAQQNQYAGALADKIPELYEMEYNQYAADAERDRADLNTLLGVKNNDLSYAGTLAEYGDLSGLKGMGVDTSKIEKDTLLEDALIKAQYGDYSGLSALEFDTSYLESNRDREDAEYYMTMYQNTGDVRYLKMIDPNIDLTKILEQDKWTEAERKGALGDYSGYDALGVDTSYAKNIQNKSLSSGSGVSDTDSFGYTDSDHSIMAIKVSLGANYWDASVWDYCRNVYGMDPIDVYYAGEITDDNGTESKDDDTSTGKEFYDILVEVLDDLGIVQTVIPPDRWSTLKDYSRKFVLDK